MEISRAAQKELDLGGKKNRHAADVLASESVLIRST